MNKPQRLILLVLLTWLLAAALAWLALSPPPPLVGGKMPPSPSPVGGWQFARPDLADSLAQLESLPLWGVSRDGSPLPPPKPQGGEDEEEVIPVVWRVIAAVSRRDGRYVLIAVDPPAPPKAGAAAGNARNVGSAAPALQTVNEGEALPNGGTLVRVNPKSIVYLDAEGKQHEDVYYF
jgi:hypothetical protein